VAQRRFVDVVATVPRRGTSSRSPMLARQRLALEARCEFGGRSGDRCRVWRAPRASGRR
jgi:hypothetical protein